MVFFFVFFLWWPFLPATSVMNVFCFCSLFFIRRGGGGGRIDSTVTWGGGRRVGVT